MSVKAVFVIGDNPPEAKLRFMKKSHRDILNSLSTSITPFYRCGQSIGRKIKLEVYSEEPLSEGLKQELEKFFSTYRTSFHLVEQDIILVV